MTRFRAFSRMPCESGASHPKIRTIPPLLLFLITVSSTPFAWAETLVGSNVNSRLTLALRVADAELQRWLPAPWQVNPIERGPSRGANLVIQFFDRLLDQDAEGKPVGGGSSRSVGLLVPAKHPHTGESATMIIRGFNANPQAVPGPFKNFVQATVRREQTLRGANLDTGTGEEVWEMREGAGGMIELRIQYERAVPSRLRREGRARSAVDPTILEIHRVDEVADVVRSIPAGIDRVQSFQLRVTVSELGTLFDGAEQLVSISVGPWYVRQTFHP